MRCKKLRKIYPKYTDGELSEQERRSVEEHICDCPDCAAEVNSLEKMRLLLQTAAEVEVSDEYWNTYWDRLEKKLPDEPAQVTLVSRISGAFAEMLRRPAVLGRVAISIIFLAFLIYTASDHLTRAPSMPPRAPIMAEYMEEVEAETSVALGKDFRKNEEAGGMASGFRQPLPGAQVGDAMALPESKSADAPVERIAGETDLAMSLKPSDIKESAADSARQFSHAAPAKSETVPALSTEAAQVQEDSEGVDYILGDVQDEYVLAEDHFQRGDYVQAIPAYQNFITANTIANVQDDRTLTAQYQIGEAQYQMGNYSDALSNFVAVANADKVERADADEGLSYDVYGREAGLKKDEKAKRIVAQSKPQAEREPRARARRQTETRGAVATTDDLAASDQMRDLSVGFAAVRKELTPAQTREALISRAIFRQAQSYENLKRHAEALVTYRVYVERYPNGEYISQAKEKITQKAAESQKEAQKQEKAGKAGNGEKDK